jgi:hypothetical protein
MIVSIRIAIFSSLISLTSGDKNVFHDCDVFAPFSGLPLGGEGEGNRRAERAKSLEFHHFSGGVRLRLRLRVASARIRDAASDWSVMGSSLEVSSHVGNIR